MGKDGIVGEYAVVVSHSNMMVTAEDKTRPRPRHSVQYSTCTTTRYGTRGLRPYIRLEMSGDGGEQGLGRLRPRAPD